MKVYRHVYTVVVVDENPDPDSQLEDLEFAVRQMECLSGDVYVDVTSGHKVKSTPKGDDAAEQLSWIQEHIEPLLST